MLNRGVMAIFIMAVLGAIMGIFVRELNDRVDIFQQVCLRLLFAFAIGNIFFYKQINYAKLKNVTAKEWGILLLRALCIYLLGIVMGTLAFINAKYSNVTVITVLPMTAILGFLFFKEKITVMKLISLLVTFAGVMLIVIKDFQNLFPFGIGETCALISIIFGALGNLSRKWQGDTLNDQEITQVLILFGIILTFTLSIIRQESYSAIYWDFRLLLILTLAGLANNMFLFCSNYGFKRVSALVANNILTVQVLIGLLVAIFLYGESLNLKEQVGTVVVVIGIIITNNLKEIKPQVNER